MLREEVMDPISEDEIALSSPNRRSLSTTISNIGFENWSSVAYT